MIKVFYEELNGVLHPKWVILENRLASGDSLIHYQIEGPFERFSEEDFELDRPYVSVSQGALTVTSPKVVSINIQQLHMDLLKQGLNPNSIYEAAAFVLLVDDLQELLSFDVRKYLTIKAKS
ncbi:hypothetical protein [Halalkalibacterium ligniniphilum]|uniref:hypothetical protein n=1 Tax=Halalkalibacterium ligniniphilum TaxID=1134413 RepID=UPI00034B9CD4|nr:hypothetical protein [Halalkalibacterium ligniniphilum]